MAERDMPDRPRDPLRAVVLAFAVMFLALGAAFALIGEPEDARAAWAWGGGLSLGFGLGRARRA